MNPLIRKTIDKIKKHNCVDEGADNPKLGKSVLICSGYAIRFNEPDSNGNIIVKDSINIKDFEQMKVSGAIEDYEIDDTGVKVITRLFLTSVSI